MTSCRRVSHQDRHFPLQSFGSVEKSTSRCTTSVGAVNSAACSSRGAAVVASAKLLVLISHLSGQCGSYEGGISVDA